MNKKFAMAAFCSRFFVCVFFFFAVFLNQSNTPSSMLFATVPVQCKLCVDKAITVGGQGEYKLMTARREGKEGNGGPRDLVISKSVSITLLGHYRLIQRRIFYVNHEVQYH